MRTGISYKFIYALVITPYTALDAHTRVTVTELPTTSQENQRYDDEEGNIAKAKRVDSFDDYTLKKLHGRRAMLKGKVHNGNS